MPGKLRLDVERLSVESFPVSHKAGEERGTVRAAQEDGCTYWDSCDCPTAYYRCAEFFYTAYSCDYGGTGPSPSSTC